MTSLFTANQARTDHMSHPFRQERQFGILLGLILCGSAAWLFHRHSFSAFKFVALGLGPLLLILGVGMPKLLIWPCRVWMKFGLLLSKITTPIILAVIYFGVITPMGTIRRIFGSNPLGRRGPVRTSYWDDYDRRQSDCRHYERMF